MGSIRQAPDEIQAAMWRLVQDEGRRVMEGMLNRMLEAERMLFVGVVPYERSALRRGRRNGYDARTLDSRWGALRLRIPKVRQSADAFRSRILRAYQRRENDVERCVLEWVACGMSTRAVSQEMVRAFGAILSAGTVSAVVSRIDADVQAFHRRPIERGYRYVYLDGKYGKVSRPARRGRGKARQAVLLLGWGIRHDGREELIDFRVAPDESEASWDGFLRGVRERGMTEENRWGERLERFITDGDQGIASALALNYPTTPHQVCVFHKVKNLLGDLRDKSLKGAIQGEAGAVFEAATRAEATARLEHWKKCWTRTEPLAVAHFMRDVDKMLLFYESPPLLRRRLKTSNPIERFIRELDRKFERVGVFPSARSWERTTYLVYRQLLQRGYAPTRPLHNLTRTS